MMTQRPLPPGLAYAQAFAAVAVVVAATSWGLPILGVTSSALLFLLPVLLAATRGGVGPGMMAAIVGGAAYNFFLLEPRFTFRVHHPDNLVSVFALLAVALVTSRLATRLQMREAEARARAQMSEEAAELSGILAGGAPDMALQQGLDMLSARYGETRLLEGDGHALHDSAAQGLSSLDLSASAWAMHNGDMTGHGTPVMAASDWTFLPLFPKIRGEEGVVAIARPEDGRVRAPAELAHLGQLCLLLGQGRDRVVLERERRQRLILDERDHLRRTFLASLAHDFRTPLTVITGQLELMAQDRADAHDALVAARRLDRMMGNLLAMARIEAGSLSLLLEGVDLIDALSAASDMVHIPPAVTLCRDVPADIPFVTADAVLLHHVLINLLDNAVRHASTRVEVHTEMQGDMIHLRVEDDGPGIAPDEQERVFERFVRLEGGDRQDGSGLGLAIVKGFADAMAMTVAVDRARLGGAAFNLAMPIWKSVS